MLAKEMILAKRYRKNNHIYKAIEKRKEYYLVQRIDNKGYYRMPYDCMVSYVFKGQDRISADELKNIIDFIKLHFCCVKKKAYLIFIKDMSKYKLYYGAQKVLVRKQIPGDIRYEKKYKNGYYAYKIAIIKKYIMEDVNETVSASIL